MYRGIISFNIVNTQKIQMKKNTLAFRFCFVSLNVIPPENFMAYKISKKKKKEKNPHKFNFHHEINVIILIENTIERIQRIEGGREKCAWPPCADKGQATLRLAGEFKLENES